MVHEVDLPLLLTGKVKNAMMNPNKKKMTK